MTLLPLTALIAKIFNRLTSTYSSDLERYVSSKNPESTYDVERWAQEFDRTHKERSWL